MALSKNDNIRITFSTNLKYYRIENNLTQAELAEKINLTDKYISDLERNKFTPSLDTINDVALIFNIEPYLLLKFNEKHFNTPNRLDIKTGTRHNKIKD